MVPMELDEGSSEQSVDAPGVQDDNDLEATSQWRESFIEHSGSGTTSRRVTWVVVGLVFVIVLTFVLAA